MSLGKDEKQYLKVREHLARLDTKPMSARYVRSDEAEAAAHEEHKNRHLSGQLVLPRPYRTAYDPPIVGAKNKQNFEKKWKRFIVQLDASIADLLGVYGGSWDHPNLSALVRVAIRHNEPNFNIVRQDANSIRPATKGQQHQKFMVDCCEAVLNDQYRIPAWIEYVEAIEKTIADDKNDPARINIEKSIISSMAFQVKDRAVTKWTSELIQQGIPEMESRDGALSRWGRVTSDFDSRHSYCSKCNDKEACIHLDDIARDVDAKWREARAFVNDKSRVPSSNALTKDTAFVATVEKLFRSRFPKAKFTPSSLKPRRCEAKNQTMCQRPLTFITRYLMTHITHPLSLLQ